MVFSVTQGDRRHIQHVQIEIDRIALAHLNAFPTILDCVTDTFGRPRLTDMDRHFSTGTLGQAGKDLCQ